MIKPISFGQTYLKSTLAYMSDENREKLKYSYGLGQIYPNDIYMGADKRGNLTLDITRCIPQDYLIINNLIECTPENISDYLLVKAMQKIGNFINGNQYPVEKYTVKNLDILPKEILAFEIQDRIEDYNIKHKKSFES